jgi:CRISPR-associated protein Csd2
MCTRDVIVFEHKSELGNARAGALFGAVKVARVDAGRPPRSWADYGVNVGELPAGVSRLKV